MSINVFCFVQKSFLFLMNNYYMKIAEILVSQQ